MRTAKLLPLLLLGALIAFPGRIPANLYTITTIDPPMAPTTAEFGQPWVEATGINNAGQIGGFYYANTNTQQPFQAAYLQNGSVFTSLVPPSAVGDNSILIPLVLVNNSGQVLVTTDNATNPSDSSYLLSGGTWTNVDVPGATSTLMLGFNDRGQFVGITTVNGVTYSFVQTGNQVVPLSFPGAVETNVSGINNQGTIVGNYSDGTHDRGFIDNNGTFTTIAVPGAGFTTVTGINNLGQVVGWYGTSSSPDTNIFVESGGVYSTFGIAGAGFIQSFGINDLGQIVGDYSNSSGTFGFLATEAVPEPSGFVSFGTSVILGLGYLYSTRVRSRGRAVEE